MSYMLVRVRGRNPSLGVFLSPPLNPGGESEHCKKIVLSASFNKGLCIRSDCIAHSLNTEPEQRQRWYIQVGPGLSEYGQSEFPENSKSYKNGTPFYAMLICMLSQT